MQRKGNKRLYLSVENLKEVLNDQRELKIKCYGSVAIRVKPLVTGTSTRLFKAQTASSLLTPGKTLTDATAPMHNSLFTILLEWNYTHCHAEERSDEASR